MGVYLFAEKITPERLGLLDTVGQTSAANGEACDMLMVVESPWQNPTRRHALNVGDTAFALEWPEDLRGPHEEENVPPPGTRTAEMSQLLQTALGFDGVPDLQAIDVDSFIDYMIIQELAANIDGYYHSTYLYHRCGRQLVAGPVWDFDLALGNTNNAGVDGGSDYWHWAHSNGCGSTSLTVFYSKTLGADTDSHAVVFRQRLWRRWQSLRAAELSNATIAARVANLTDQLIDSGAASRNFDTWSFQKAIWPGAGPLAFSYRGEVRYLSEWLLRRAAFLDRAFAQVGPSGALADPDFCLLCEPWVPPTSWRLVVILTCAAVLASLIGIFIRLCCQRGFVGRHDGYMVLHDKVVVAGTGSA